MLLAVFAAILIDDDQRFDRSGQRDGGRDGRVGV